MIDRLTRDDLPSGWALSKLVDIANINMGQSPSSDTYNYSGQGIPFFQGKAEFGEMYPKINKYCSKPIKIAKKDEVLISVRAPIGPTNIAFVDCCIGRGLASIRTFGGISQRYILYYLRLIETDLIKLGTGSTFKSISKNDLENIPVPLPPLITQMAIVERIEELLSGLAKSKEQLELAFRQIQCYKQSILKEIFEQNNFPKRKLENLLLFMEAALPLKAENGCIVTMG